MDVNHNLINFLDIREKAKQKQKKNTNKLAVVCNSSECQSKCIKHI